METENKTTNGDEQCEWTMVECASCGKDFEPEDGFESDGKNFCSRECETAAWKTSAMATAGRLIYADLKLTGCSGKSEAEYYASDDDDDFPRLRLATHDPVYDESCDCVCLGVGSDCVDCDYVIKDDADDPTIKSVVEQALLGYAKKVTEWKKDQKKIYGE